MRKGLLLFAAAMLLSLASMAQNAETVDVSKERDGLYNRTFNKTRVEGTVKNGVKEGNWCEFDVDKNSLRRVIQYHNGKKDGIYLELTENGYVVKKSEFTEDGVMVKKNTYKDDKLDGEQTALYDNGKLQEVAHYKDGTRDGETTWYGREGNKRMTINYKRGEFDGEQQTYYPNGTLKSAKMFKNNVAHGKCIEYEENGEVKLECTYKDGEIVGKMKKK